MYILYAELVVFPPPHRPFVPCRDRLRDYPKHLTDASI
jgi:hypothetical protein